MMLPHPPKKARFHREVAPLVAQSSALINVIHRQKIEKIQWKLKQKWNTKVQPSFVRYGAKWCVHEPRRSLTAGFPLGQKLATLATKMAINIITVSDINGEILTAMRVCEDALRYKMILFFCCGRGRSFLDLVRSKLESHRLLICSTSREEPAAFTDLPLFYLIASLRDVRALCVHAASPFSLRSRDVD